MMSNADGAEHALAQPASNDRLNLVGMASSVVAAMITNRQDVSIGEVTDLISQVHSSLAALVRADSDAGTVPAMEKPEPACSVAESIQPDHLICLEDGKKLKMLKRHLWHAYGMTPEKYRERWSLPEDYPMTAPNYSKKRSKLAKESGLGRRAA